MFVYQRVEFLHGHVRTLHTGNTCTKVVYLNQSKMNSEIERSKRVAWTSVLNRHQSWQDEEKTFRLSQPPSLCRKLVFMWPALLVLSYDITRDRGKVGDQCTQWTFGSPFYGAMRKSGPYVWVWVIVFMCHGEGDQKKIKMSPSPLKNIAFTKK